jgi:hypothetical protein
MTTNTTQTTDQSDKELLVEARETIRNILNCPIPMVLVRIPNAVAQMNVDKHLDALEQARATLQKLQAATR